MQPKDSKNIKSTHSQGFSINSKNKKIDDKMLINKLLTKTKSSKIPNDSNTQNKKYHDIKNNTQTKKLSSEIKINEQDKNKKKEKTVSKYQTKSNNDRDKNKIDYIKSKISGKLDKKEKKSKRNTPRISKAFDPKMKPFERAKTNYINSKKIKNLNKFKNINKEKESGIESKKLFELLASLSPIDTNRCNNLINNNLSKIIELENKVKEIMMKTQEEVEEISNKENKNLNNLKENRISLEQNIEIINKESKMRKDVYIILFNFITQLLEQINKLSNNIAENELTELNNVSNNDNIFLINNKNNCSITSNNSLFASEIQDEFCGQLMNLTQSFMNNDFDISRINFNGDIKFGKNLDDNLFNDDDDFKEYNALLKNKSKKTGMMHPNEILNKIKNDDKKNKKVIHHYSNSLRVNSNLEKLEEKINNDEDNINIEQFENLRNMMQQNNCSIF